MVCPLASEHDAEVGRMARREGHVADSHPPEPPELALTAGLQGAAGA